MRRILVLVASLMCGPVTFANAGEVIGSDRSDLWIVGAQEKGGVHRTFQLYASQFPPSRWGLDTSEFVRKGALMYTAPLEEGESNGGLLAQLRGEEFHVSKFDDQSSFIPGWGLVISGEYAIPVGTILRIESGALKLIPDALQVAREAYGLRQSQNFLGMVGTRVFYFDQAEPDKIFFFDRDHKRNLSSVIVPVNRLWPRSWKLKSATQVFSGNSDDEVLVEVVVRNTAWISFAPRRDFTGISVDLRSASKVK